MTNNSFRLYFQQKGGSRKQAMAIYRTRVEWHDLRIAPDDLPEEGEEVLVTTENIEGARRVQANVYLKTGKDDRYFWCTLVRDLKSGRMEEAAVWYEVIAWAYYPDPHIL